MSDRAKYERYRGTPEFEEGKRAALMGQQFKTHCPYFFKDSGATQQIFDALIRHKLDAWFAGWFLHKDTKEPTP